LPEIPPVFTAPDGYQRRFTAVQQAEANGIVYEANLTVPYQTELTLPDPVADWWELIHRSPVPFAVFFAYRQWVVLGASPERLLRLDNHKLTTQPIKGTRKRVPSDPVADAQARNELVMSTKNRAENLMIADLARAELYRSAVRHSVWVPQLFEIQVFANLFHLVSTVRATLHPDVPPHVALRTVFPAGSMTGAPKFWVLRLLDEIEPHDRGLYAGSIGWTFPGGFDINVVIRSFVHDRLTSLLTYQVGGAITVYSDLEDEQAENDLKAHYLEHLFHS
jgi:para-aminobenzoate synthetase component 1